MINSRRIEDLHPVVIPMALKFLELCKKQENIDVIITSTYRDHAAQQALYDQGRVTPGKIVTNALPGKSWHNWRLAFDFVPIVNGKAQWNDKELFLKCGLIAESIGLEWAGRWKGKLRETAHCQYTGGLTLADLQAGKQLK